MIASQRIKKRHDRLRASKLCIASKHHGLAVKGGRCQACWDRKLKRERERYQDKNFDK